MRCEFQALVFGVTMVLIKVAVPLILTLACLTFFMWIRLSSAGMEPTILRSYIWRWLAWQSIIAIALLSGWYAWHRGMYVLCESAADWKLQIALAIIAVMPAGVGLILLLRWLNALWHMHPINPPANDDTVQSDAEEQDDELQRQPN